MKVSLGTITVDALTRRAINAHYGKPGLASRADVKAIFISLADADLETIVADFQQAQTPEPGAGDETA